MKSDLNALMQKRNLDVLLITGPAKHNPAMYYMTGGGHLTNADLIIQRGSPPILFYSPMERDEAARTGLMTKNLEDYPLVKLLKQTEGDIAKALVLRYQKMFTDLGIATGRVAIYGKVDAGKAYALFKGLQEAMPGLSIIGEVDESTFTLAMASKDASEVERIRQMGQITTAVVAQVADYLSSRQILNEVLIEPDGQPLTVGAMKKRINLWLAERGAEAPDGTIFAIGHDAGVPHSAGTPEDELRLGRTIVFDIFPCEGGGGYYYDFTRTWCLGYATDGAQALYEDVLAVYQQVTAELKIGAHCPDYQKLACELFEARGHPTTLSHPGTQQGYVHGLGHGVGLHVHELPRFGRNGSLNDRLEAGAVVTIEPGLYYPERELGVRLEDTLWVRPDGNIEILAEYPLDLVLPMRSKGS